MKKITFLSVVAFVGMFALVAEANAASTVADVANTVLSNVKSLPRFLVTIAYVMGCAAGVMAALKFKEHNESKGQIKLMVPIAYTIGAVLLIGVPLALDTGLKTFGYNSTGYSSKSGGY